jgi:transcription elongation factor GreA
MSSTAALRDVGSEPAVNRLPRRCRQEVSARHYELPRENVTYRDFVAPPIEEKTMSRLPMTAAGHSALEDELKQRVRVERPRLVQRIQEAIADDSNLAENSEYQAAKAEQEINEAGIVELEDKLARAEVIDVSKLFGDTIKFGATVTLIEEDTGEKKVWQIVGEPEADVKKGKISVTSPVARALIGKTKGATIEVEAPGGAKVYKIRRVGWA